MLLFSVLFKLVNGHRFFSFQALLFALLPCHRAPTPRPALLASACRGKRAEDSAKAGPSTVSRKFFSRTTGQRVLSMECAAYGGAVAAVSGLSHSSCSARR
jgi:hypothetical protein